MFSTLCEIKQSDVRTSYLPLFDLSSYIVLFNRDEKVVRHTYISKEILIWFFQICRWEKHHDLPCTRDILGRVLTFQQKLSRFNFLSKHHSFTISHILDHNQRSPFLILQSREVMTTPEMIFQELYIEILLKLFKEVLLSTTTDLLLMSWWKATQEQPLNLPKTLFAMVKLQIIGASWNVADFHSCFLSSS
ncbi:hypothetical protein N665_0300s0013 [Sinapis alba]|nr:hypothetical protein N665_0300s0013 [Sinapis alba]